MRGFSITMAPSASNFREYEAGTLGVVRKYRLYHHPPIILSIYFSHPFFDGDSVSRILFAECPKGSIESFSLDLSEGGAGHTFRRSKGGRQKMIRDVCGTECLAKFRRNTKKRDGGSL